MINIISNIIGGNPLSGSGGVVPPDEIAILMEGAGFVLMEPGDNILLE